MSTKITNNLFSNLTGASLPKIKRFARDFLGPDPAATRQSGRAREYSEEDGFIIYLGEHLVSVLKYTTPEAKQIIGDLKPWLVSRGLFPNSSPATDQIDFMIDDYDIEIWPAKRSNSFFYEAKGFIQKAVVERKRIAGQVHTTLVDRYVMFPIKEELFSEAPTRADLSRRFLSKVLHISHLLRAYNMALGKIKLV